MPRRESPASLPWYQWHRGSLENSIPLLCSPCSSCHLLCSQLIGNQGNFPSLWNQVSGCIPPQCPPPQSLIASFEWESWESEPLSAQSFPILLAKAESHVEMSSAAPSFLPLFPPPFPITPVVSSFENSLLLPMGPTLKNKEGGDWGETERKLHCLVKGNK